MTKSKKRASRKWALNRNNRRTKRTRNAILRRKFLAKKIKDNNAKLNSEFKAEVVS